MKYNTAAKLIFVFFLNNFTKISNGLMALSLFLYYASSVVYKRQNAELETIPHLIR